MTPDLLDLARSVVALPGWQWMPGMLLTTGDRVCRVEVHRDGGLTLHLSDQLEITTALGEGWQLLGPDVDASAEPPLPDLTDAATGGCMLAMLGPCEVDLSDEGARISHKDVMLTIHSGHLGVACARVAVARGMWAA